MNKKLILSAILGASVCTASGAVKDTGRHMGGELDLKADRIAANRQTGELLATGNVTAASGVYRFRSERLTRNAEGVYDLGHPAGLTTCTNEMHKLHWQLRGEFEYNDGTSPDDQKSVIVRNAWLYWMDYPVMWVPFWYYPMDTNYGWRFLPGYTSKWGGFFLSGYVYNIVNEGKEDAYSLGGSTYFDYRTKNGEAVGQTIRWNLKQFGKGKIKGYYAWDDDYDRYKRHWTDAHHENYQNWGSEVDRERYRLTFEHSADLTERDSIRAQATYLSDSHFMYDFFEGEERGESIPVNEIAYEHRENDWAAGAGVSGPLNEFYGGTARLPEGWFSLQPQPLFDLPVNYESQARVGYLNRNFARYASDNPRYRYRPYIGTDGRGADYQAMRADFNNRLSLPMKFWDTLSFVPRVGYRATAWSDSGNVDTLCRTASGDALYRGVAEMGFTASTRGEAWLSETWKHTVEPYLDYSFQRAYLNGGDKGVGPYIFDNLDGSVDWLDQFDFEGRGLPYSWHGVRPGVRNYFQRRDDKGNVRTLVDTDAYAAIPFSDESYFENGPLNGHPKDPEDGHYSRHENVVPGFRARLFPTDNTMLASRTEYECDSEKFAYADFLFRHQLSRTFKYDVSYIGRDHRIWDYLPSAEDRYNYQLENILHLGYTQDVCDWFAYSPFIRFDARRNDVEEFGTWFDFMTDCLAYRLMIEHVSSYERDDGSKHDADTRIGFYIYLRALGPSSMLDLIRF